MIRRARHALVVLLVASAGVAAPTAQIRARDPEWAAPP